MGIETVVSRSEFEDVLQRVQRLLNRVEQEANLLVDRSNRAMTFLPAFAANNLKESLDDFRGLLSALFKALGEILPSPGWPPALYETGDAWTNRVGAVASALAGKATTDQTSVDEKWQGPAATAYTQALTAQAKALTAIKAATDEVDDALFKMSFGLVACWVGLAAALVTYVVELCAAAGAALSGIGAPAGAAGAGISTVKMVAIVATVVTALLTLATVIATQYKDLNQRLANNDGFPGGSWPRIKGGDMSDARVTDGDGTDWQLKY